MTTKSRAAPKAATSSAFGAIATLHPQWADLPTNARYLFALADQAGLTIGHNGTHWTWTGTEQQHRASGLWPASLSWDFKRYRRVWTVEGLSSLMRRDQAHPDRICATHRSFDDGDSSRACKPALARAASDDTFKGFIAKTLQTVDCSGDEVPAPTAPAHRPQHAPERRRADGAHTAQVDLMAHHMELVMKRSIRSTILITVDLDGEPQVCYVGINTLTALGLVTQMATRIARNLESPDDDAEEEES